MNGHVLRMNEIRRRRTIMFNLDDCIALITCRSSKVFVTALEHRLRRHNITRIQSFALYYIHQNSCITQRELADFLAVREPAVARLVRELEHLGLLVRKGSSTDKRVHQLLLTNLGENLYEEVMKVIEEFKADTVHGICEEDLQTLKSCLALMVENAKNNDRNYKDYASEKV